MEEDIDYLKRHIKVIGKTRSTEAIENLINKYKELEKERDSIYADYQDLGKEKLKLEEKCEEQEKMIELMAEYIKETDFITESYCYRREDCENVGGNRKCKECILDYFRKKAKGE